MTAKVLAYVGPTHNSDGQPTVNYTEHANAILLRKTNDFGRALIKILSAWEEYAQAHERRYEAPIGEDYVIGPYWANVGLAIKRLLDGDTGGLDCGSLAANISDAITAQGIEHDGYNLIEKE